MLVEIIGNKENLYYIDLSTLKKITDYEELFLSMQELFVDEFPAPNSNGKAFICAIIKIIIGSVSKLYKIFICYGKV